MCIQLSISCLRYKRLSIILTSKNVFFMSSHKLLMTSFSAECQKLRQCPVYWNDKLCQCYNLFVSLFSFTSLFCFSQGSVAICSLHCTLPTSVALNVLRLGLKPCSTCQILNFSVSFIGGFHHARIPCFTRNERIISGYIYIFVIDQLSLY